MSARNALPAQSIVDKFARYAGEIAMLTPTVTSHRADQEVTAVLKKPVLEISDLAMMLLPFRAGMSARLQNSEINRAAQARQNMMRGHDIRCALLMIWDKTGRQIALTEAEKADLDSCLSVELNGRPVYADLRAMNLAVPV